MPLGESTALSGCFFLAKAGRSRLTAVRPFSAWLRCVADGLVVALPMLPVAARMAVLDRLIRLFHTVPAYVLHFRKDNSFWKVIDELEEKEQAETRTT